MKPKMNHVYVLSTTDEYEYILYVADDIFEMAEYLNINPATICKMIDRHKIRENLEYKKNIKFEKVIIRDYIFVVYEKSIEQPLCVSRDMGKIAKMLNMTQGRISMVVHKRVNNKRKLKLKQSRDIPRITFKGKRYLIDKIDLLDLNINLSNFLESCIDKGILNYEENRNEEKENQL